MKKLGILLLGIFMLTACGNKYTLINANQAKSLIEEGAIIIDVRTADEYNTDHIDNAINIPLDNIEAIDYNLDNKIIVYCATGIRSKEAAKALVKKGYTNIYDLDGGLLNWG